jgi:hypothetical protein
LQQPQSDIFFRPLGRYITSLAIRIRLPMPRYFFHTTNGKYTTDAEGLDFPDASAAQTAAIKLAGELLKDAPDLLSETANLKVEVTDAEALPMFTVLVTVANSAAGR